MFQDRAQAAAPDLYAYKTADETVTESTSMQDDNHLFVSVKSGRKYIFRSVLYFDSVSVAPKVALSGTTTITNFIAKASAMKSTSHTLVDVSTFSTGVSVATSGSDFMVVIEGALEPATDGTFLIQWAQSSAIADTIIKRGSSLSVWRLA